MATPLPPPTRACTSQATAAAMCDVSEDLAVLLSSKTHLRGDVSHYLNGVNQVDALVADFRNAVKNSVLGPLQSMLTAQAELQVRGHGQHTTPRRASTPRSVPRRCVTHARVMATVGRATLQKRRTERHASIKALNKAQSCVTFLAATTARPPVRSLLALPGAGVVVAGSWRSCTRRA